MHSLKDVADAGEGTSAVVTHKVIETWATETAQAIAAGQAPSPLLPNRVLTAYEAETSHRLLRRALKRAGIDIDVPPDLVR